jgi:hypothetical protein
MWSPVAIERVPPTLQRFGLGADPVWSENDQQWYAKSGDQWMVHPGVGATYTPTYSTTCVGCKRTHKLANVFPNPHIISKGDVIPRGQHQSLGAPATGLGDLTNNPPLDAAASALGSALQGGATTSTMNGICSAFQSAYNAAGGSPAIQVDDYYGPCTQAALQAYYNAAVSGGSGAAQQAPASAFGGTCNNGTYVAPTPGGTSPTDQGPAVPPPGLFTGLLSNPYATPILIGAGVVTAGAIGYAVWKHHKKTRRTYRVVSPSHRLR